MHKNSTKQSNQPTGPFKAKLRHYHRTASPELYSRKQKRWEDVSPSELGDASVSDTQGKIDLRARTSSNKEGSKNEG